MRNLRAPLLRHGSAYKLSNAWRRARWFAASSVASATLIATPLFATMTAHAQSDVTPPNVTNVSLTAAAPQDISTPSGAHFGVNVDALDDLSGMSGLSTLTYTSPSGNQTTTANIQQRPGTTDPSLWYFDVGFPQYSETGVWTPTLTMLDATGNQQVWTNSDLLAKGWDIQITLTGTSDTTPPDISSASLASPATVDSSTSPDITINLLPIETQSGMAGSSGLQYTSPSGKQTCIGSLNPDGTGNFVGYCQILSHAEDGTWVPTVTLIDAVGNKAVFTNADLLARGIDLRVNVSGQADTTPPTVNNLKFVLSSPVVDAVPYAGAVVSIGGSITDDMSGIATAHIRYTSGHGQIADGDFNLQPDGTYTANVGLPSYAESGTWEPHITVTDGAGNLTDLDGTALKNMGYDISFGVTKNITGTAAPGGTVTSDVEGDGATATDPVEAAVTSPSGGNISIVIVDSSTITDQTNGYQFFGRQVSISAPQESAANPLTLNFQIDSSVIPAGQDQNTLQVTRNGAVIPACTDSTTATPDPCIFSRQLLSDGDISVSIHSSTASIWGSGFPTPPPSKYHFSGFDAPVQKNGLTSWKAGTVVPLSFSLGGTFGTSILTKGYPTVQPINCTTLTATSTATPAMSVANTGLLYVLNKYAYAWQTNKKWKNTCQQLTFKLDDGTTFSAPFKF